MEKKIWNLLLMKEVRNIKSDITFLGWCYAGRRVPMCLHAYMLTRSGVSKLLEHWNVCDENAIDAQLRYLVESGIISWGKVDESSYKDDLKDAFIDNPMYFTHGIFTQKKGVVSFNHHGFQNNAG